MPAKLSVSDEKSVQMPTSLPSASTSAPPELPGLIVASVWIRLV